jgi:sugar phosphate isomerase/epimerase
MQECPMSIELALSTAICPDYTAEKVIELAQAVGIHQVELITTSSEYPALACDPMVGDPHKLSEQFKAADIKVACIQLSVCMHHEDKHDIAKAQSRVEHAFRVARTLGCPYVRIQGNNVKPHESRRRVISRMVDNVHILGEKAAEHGVTLLFENNGSFAKAKDWWTLLNMVEHPMLGVCWNPTNAYAVGEMPGISIPMLHHRIHVVRVNDLAEGSGNNFVAIGEGSVPVREVIHRLMGIGFGRVITIAYDKAWLPVGVDIVETLTNWMTESAAEIEAAQVKIDKLAARNAPKPRVRAS